MGNASYSGLKPGQLYTFFPGDDPTEEIRCLVVHNSYWGDNDVSESECHVRKHSSWGCDPITGMPITGAVISDDLWLLAPDALQPIMVLDVDYRPAPWKFNTGVGTRFLIKLLAGGKMGWVRIRSKTLDAFKPVEQL